MHRFLPAICSFCLVELLCTLGVPAQDPSLQVQLPAGFALEQAADNDLATNIYRLAQNPRGELFVSGPDYIRQLVDSNQDGVFEQAKLFSTVPRSGAQGLFCADDLVLAVGDGGVWRFLDRDQDGVADDAPEQLLKIGTGGEHLAHQIKPGPDGWWYLIAGNQTPISTQFFAGHYSPIKLPRAGFLMRISPDFTHCEVVAHGFRNAYDFAFNDRDEIFVYDSDDEREAGLPWYRPTRLFQVQPGDDAGWLNDGWKRPSYFFDMPIEVSATGRGSPTGVVCYQGHQFPQELDNAIFFADWTFGRIWIVKRDPGTLEYGQPTLFASTRGQFGFAVTDLMVDRQGSLLVSVGGRGTSGGIYRIKFNGPPRDKQSNTVGEPLELQKLARKRTTWDAQDWETAIGLLEKTDSSLSLDSLESSLQRTSRNKVLAALIGRGNELNTKKELHQRMAQVLEVTLTHFDPNSLKLVLRLGLELDRQILEQIEARNMSIVGQILLSYLLDDTGDRRMELNEQIVSRILKVLKSESPPPESELLACCRIGQLALGDFGGSGGNPAFEGFTANESVDLAEEPRRVMADLFQAAINLAPRHDYWKLRVELARSAALLNLDSTDLQAALLKPIGRESNAVDDLHWLYCLARSGSLMEEERQLVVPVLVELPNKFGTQHILTDRNWETRLQSLYRSLISATPKLADQLLELFDGNDNQIFWIACFPVEQQTLALDRLAKRIAKSPKQASLKQLRAIFDSGALEYQSVFRLLTDQPQLQELSILALTRWPVETDRVRYREGLLSRNLVLVKNSAIALRKLEKLPGPKDLLCAYRAMLRLTWNDQNVSVRDHLIALIQTNSEAPRDYQTKKPNLDQSAAIAKIGDWLQGTYPDEFTSLVPPVANWQRTFERADWNRGNADRGKALFGQLKCAQCHQGNSALGPSLEGVAKRFSRADIFRLVGEPAIRISDRYRGKVVITTAGETIFGLTIYESVDGITLQDSSGQTIRIEKADIESIRDSDQSLMPSGLLDELTPEQFADLDAYLQSQ